mmetsp:Transcript_6655/g.9225  ORF Transcript_6655/g.9225 Transcript_6655/m.9225 type:complete len:712 (-) Transcript_6655:774-2909(-)
MLHIYHRCSSWKTHGGSPPPSCNKCSEPLLQSCSQLLQDGIGASPQSILFFGLHAAVGPQQFLDLLGILGVPCPPEPLESGSQHPPQCRGRGSPASRQRKKEPEGRGGLQRDVAARHRRGVLAEAVPNQIRQRERVDLLLAGQPRRHPLQQLLRGREERRNAAGAQRAGPCSHRGGGAPGSRAQHRGEGRGQAGGVRQEERQPRPAKVRGAGQRVERQQAAHDRQPRPRLQRGRERAEALARRLTREQVQGRGRLLLEQRPQRAGLAARQEPQSPRQVQFAVRVEVDEGPALLAAAAAVGRHPHGRVQQRRQAGGAQRAAAAAAARGGRVEHFLEGALDLGPVFAEQPARHEGVRLHDDAVVRVADQRHALQRDDGAAEDGEVGRDAEGDVVEHGQRVVGHRLQPAHGGPGLAHPVLPPDLRLVALGAAALDVGAERLVHQRHHQRPIAVVRQDAEGDEVIHQRGVVLVGQVDQGGDHRVPVPLLHRRHETVVDQRHPAPVAGLVHHQDVPRVGVGVEEPFLQQLDEEGLLRGRDQAADLLRAGVGQLVPVDPLRHQHSPGRVLHVHLRHKEARPLEQLAELHLVGGLVHEVQLCVEPDGPLVEESLVVRPLLWGKPLHHSLVDGGRAAKHVQVLGHRLQHRRPLDLDGDDLARGLQPRPVHLGQGGGGHGLLGDLREELPQRPTQLRLDLGHRHLGGEPLHVVLQLPQLR